MVDLLTSKTNESFKEICDSIEEGQKIDFYVLPIETKLHASDLIVLSYIKNDEVKFVKVKYNEFGEDHSFNPGQKFTAFKYKEGEFINKIVPKWRKAVKYSNTVFCYGQKIIIIDSEKRDIAIKLGDEFEKNNDITFRVVIKGASGDSLYNFGENDNTITCNPFKNDLTYIDLYTAITKAIALAHEGKNVVFILDSILNLAYSLRSVFPNSRLIAGSIPYHALSLIKNLVSLGGEYNGGTLTMVCIYNRRNNDGDRGNEILEELADSYNGSIWLDSTNIFNESKVQSTTSVEPYQEYPYVNIFGKKIYY